MVKSQPKVTPVKRLMESLEKSLRARVTSKPDCLRSRLINRLERSLWLAIGLRRVRGIFYGVGWGAFHCDAIYRQMVLELLGHFKFTSFVETGTFRGYSTEFIASHYSHLPVFTSEVMPLSYKLSRNALSKYSNVTTHLGNSSDWIGEKISQHCFGNFPLFYLDAHWQRYWPLRDELRHIATVKLRTIIVIDDFEVPEHPEFGFDIDGGGEVVEGQNCNLDYIRPALLPPNSYHAVFPKYSQQDANLSSWHGSVRGHVILFQNAAAEYEAFCRCQFVQEHYWPGGLVSPNRVA
jgi:hypothetical protein